jgi:predicted component of type VI protein secretion system
MDQLFSVGRTDVEITAAMERGEGVPDAKTPFRILLIGDITGRANRALVNRAAGEREPVQVDRDSLDAAIRRFAPELELNVPAAGAASLAITLADSKHGFRSRPRIETPMSCSPASDCGPPQP